MMKELGNTKEYREKHSECAKNFWNSKSEDEMKQFGEKMKDVWKNSSEEYKKSFSEKMSYQRTHMTPEAKENRKQLIIKNINDNIEHYKKIWKEMSDARKGIGNPMSKRIEYDGKIYSMKEFKEKFGKDISKYENDPLFKKLYEERTYEILTCPYCKKQSKGNPSGFLRWHMDNCRYKLIEERNNEN